MIFQVRLMLWDTAGQEEFDCITKAYYRFNYHNGSIISHIYDSFQGSSLLPSIVLNNGPRLLPPCQRVEEEGD